MTTENPIYAKVFPARGGRFIAFGKFEPWIGGIDAQSAMMQPGDVWFEYGDTYTAAHDALIADMQDA